MDQDEAERKYIVKFGKTFAIYYDQRYSNQTLDFIDDFIEHFEINGFSGWKGKFGPSDKVPKGTPDRQKLIDKAQFHQLWHVHIGMPKWETTPGRPYSTSDWVLHLKKHSKYKITLLDLGWHSPFLLPSDVILNEDRK